MSVSLIWAQTSAGVIGRGGVLPWHLPEDLARFKHLTTGSSVVMGRKTWDSLPARFRPLPQRQNIVISRQAGWSAEGATGAASVAEALERATEPDVWITGGAEIFHASMDLADRVEVTEIDATIDGDTFAPAIGANWRLQAVDPVAGWHHSREGLNYRYLSYVRTGSLVE